MESKITEEMDEILEALGTVEERKRPARENLSGEADTRINEELLAKLQRGGLIEAAACEFEHLLAGGITNSIGTLLGRPRFCPHNRPIPGGDCCCHAHEDVKQTVISCDQMKVGETGRIAYFSTPEHGRMLKLSALSITPGGEGRLKPLQKWPSFVVQCDKT